MRQRLNQRGTTLLEQLIALLLGSTVIVGLYGFYRAQLYQTLAQETKTAAVQDGRDEASFRARRGRHRE